MADRYNKSSLLLLGLSATKISPGVSCVSGCLETMQRVVNKLNSIELCMNFTDRTGTQRSPRRRRHIINNVRQLS